MEGKRLAIVSADEWEAMIEWLETPKDVQIVERGKRQALLAQGGV